MKAGDPLHKIHTQLYPQLAGSIINPPHSLDSSFTLLESAPPQTTPRSHCTSRHLPLRGFCACQLSVCTGCAVAQ